MWELLWYNFSLVCRLPAPWLYIGANGDLLQEDLCHTLCLPGPVLPESLSPWLATTDPCLCRRPSNTHRHVCLCLLWRSLLLSQGPGTHKALLVPSKHFWWVWGLILNAIVTILPSSCDFSFDCLCGAPLGGSPLSMVVQQLVVILCSHSWVHILILHHLAKCSAENSKFPFQKDPET